MNIDQTNQAMQDASLPSDDHTDELDELDPLLAQIDPDTYEHAGTGPVAAGAERWLVTYTLDTKLTPEQQAELDASMQDDLESDDDEDDEELDGDDEELGDGDEGDEEDGEEDDADTYDEEEEDFDGDDEDEELRQSAGPYFGDTHSVFVDFPAGLAASEVQAIFERDAEKLGLIPEGMELTDVTPHYIVVESVVDLSKAEPVTYGDDEDDGAY